MKSEATERQVIIEQHKRFSQSALWRMQRDYFDKAGINAWVNQVPFYITSNPYIATCYAKIVAAFMRDWTQLHPGSHHQPFYIMELGTGSGRFSYYFVKSLLELLEGLALHDIRFCYVMSDFTPHNVKYWEDHPALRPYIEQGLIDFALYDMEAQRPIHLMRKNVHLSPELLTNPLTVLANYIFDTVSHDAFTVHEDKLYELLFSLHTEETNMEHHRPLDMEKIQVDYRVSELKSAYYGDPHLDAILERYKKELHSTSFLIPIGSLRAIQFLKKLCHDQLFVVSTDKGYGMMEQLDDLGHPAISFHGSFSMMVNFHAVSEYFKNSGGDAFLQSRRSGIRTSAFASGFKIQDLPETRVALVDWVERMSPSDYFTLHSRVRDHFDDYDLDTLASHMELSGWDPHIYLKISSQIVSLLPEGDPETVAFMAHNMPRLAANYYHMPKTECILFEIGVFFHTIKNYTQALHYYQQAHRYVGDLFGLFYNMALCAQHVGKKETALDYFKQALVLEPGSHEVAEQITLLEKAQAGEGSETQA